MTLARHQHGQTSKLAIQIQLQGQFTLAGSQRLQSMLNQRGQSTDRAVVSGILGLALRFILGAGQLQVNRQG
jgi:hypothetical protein